MGGCNLLRKACNAETPTLARPVRNALPSRECRAFASTLGAATLTSPRCAVSCVNTCACAAFGPQTTTSSGQRGFGSGPASSVASCTSTEPLSWPCHALDPPRTPQRQEETPRHRLHHHLLRREGGGLRQQETVEAFRGMGPPEEQQLHLLRGGLGRFSDR